MSRKSISSLVLLVAVAVLGFLVYPHIEQYVELQLRRKQSEAQQAIFRQQTQALMAESAKNEALARKLPRPDFQFEDLPTTARPGPSAWRSSEKAFYESILTKGRFEVLLVPAQVQDQAFARDLRSLMTAQLAMAIADSAKVSLPDPYLVARAMGDGERRLELGEIFRLANALGAKRIIAPYIGHDDKNAMRVTLHAYDRREGETFNEAEFGPHPAGPSRRLVASERLKSQHFEQIAYSDETTPIDALQALLPAMLQFLDLDAAAVVAAKPVSRFEVAELPKSPLDLVSDAGEPARDAYALHLMAVLSPRWADRERERLIEKSMLAVLHMSPQSPDYRVLKARALMYMGLRPAALRVLATPATAEEKHLVALLNGNLPELRANRPAVPVGIRRFIAAVEQSAIAAAYDLNDKNDAGAVVTGLKLPGRSWSYLAQRAASDPNRWAQHDNLQLKMLLDRELPVEGFTAKGMLRGAIAVGDMYKVRASADLSVLEHVRKFIERSAAQYCCQSLVARFTRADFIDLAEGIATDNLSRRARFLTNVQASPDSAIAFLASVESTYKDHPDFVVARAMAELAKAKASSGPEKEGLLSSAYTAGRSAWYWEQGQTPAAAAAFDDVITEAGRNDYFHNAYVDDYPYRPYYTFWQYGGDALRAEASARVALQNSTFEFWPVTYLESSLGELRKRWDDVDAVMKSIEGRFNGHPARIKLLAQLSGRRGDRQAAERYYADAIRLQPAEQTLYTELGRLLFENGARDKAARVFMSFPGIKGQSVHPVALSNYAYEAGSLYYWTGDFQHAIPLYKIAADLDTGSAASMTSALRLALLNGDYLGALRGSLARAQRYNQPHAYRDYLGLLHAIGASKEAWDGFRTLVRHIDQPQVWETALVGHRIQGASEADIAAWAAQEPMRSAGKEISFAAMYLLRASVTDRMPSAELPARIVALEHPVWKVEDEYQHVVRQDSDGTRQYVLGRNSPHKGATLPLGVFDRSKKIQVKSDLVYFAEAYAAIRVGKFDAARAALQDASMLYDMRNESLGYLLPAYAYAAARARDTAALEKMLDGFTAQYQKFDYYLAKAALAGIAGKRDVSLQLLELALVRRPFTEQRPIYIEYQYAEICEWLYESTRDARYRSLAIDWAKKNQAFNPWFAWPYAMEARLTTNPSERGRAIAMAYYLDRKSERLGMLPKREVQNAVKEYANRNPFRRAADVAPKQPV